MRPRSGDSMDKDVMATLDDWTLDMEEHGDIISVNVTAKPREKYPAKLHARSVAKRLAVKSGLVYIPGLPFLDYEDSDQPVAFRQRRYFYYLSGLNFPGCALTYDIGRDRLSAFIPPANYGSSVIFNGSNPTREEIKAKHDFDDVQRIANLAYCLASFIKQDPESKIFVLHEYDVKQSLLQRVAQSTGRDEKSKFDYTMLKPAMNAARVIKSPYELKMIRKASAITAQAHINVLRAIKTLENEAEIEAIFAATCISEQAKQQAYGIIAGAGSNASTLHYIANNEPLKGRQLVCLDAGCEWKCYASDVTRTFPISGKWTEEGKAIYDLVARMQEECIAMVKPGANFRDIHFHAHKVAVDGLMKLGLLHNGTFEELYAARASVAFFPHGLGHYLGLECHDVGDGGNLLLNQHKNSRKWANLKCGLVSGSNAVAASILAPNHVITVEPGIYFSRYALEEVWLKDGRYAKYINKDLLAKYYPVGGVRIEDDILVTEDGYENLTTAPKGDEALKIINEAKETGKLRLPWF